MGNTFVSFFKRPINYGIICVVRIIIEQLVLGIKKQLALKYWQCNGHLRDFSLFLHFEIILAPKLLSSKSFRIS